MIQRWKISYNRSMVTEPDGEWVEYKDHLAVVAEKDKEIERLKGRHKCNCPRCGGGSLDVYEKEDSDGE